MLQHVVVGDVVPALLVLSLRGPLCAFVVPAPLGRAVAAVPPVAAIGLWAASLAAWHVPSVYDAAAAHAVLHDAEHASFFVAGMLVWSQLLDPLRRGRLGPWASLGFALALLTAGQILGNTLVLTDTLLYPAYAHPEHPLAWLSPRTDQDLAGIAMMVEQALVLGAYAAWRLRGSLRAAPAPGLASGRHPLAS